MTNRPPFEHAIYITSSFLLIAWAWLWLGGGSVLVRAIHLLLVISLLLGSLSITLASKEQLAWTGAALVNIPSLLAMPLFVAARVGGWRLTMKRGRIDQAEKGDGQSIITVGQMLWMTTAFAILSLAARPIIHGLGGVTQLRWPIVHATVIALTGLVALYLGASPARLLRRLGSAMATLCVLVLIGESLVLATYGGWWRPWPLDDTTIRYGLGIYCTTYFLAASRFSLERRNGFTRPRY